MQSVPVPQFCLLILVLPIFLRPPTHVLMKPRTQTIGLVKACSVKMSMQVNKLGSPFLKGFRLLQHRSRHSKPASRGRV
jgi:hypothetical protein